MTSQPKPKTLVMKFGGSSVGTPKAMLEVIDIIRQTRPDWPNMLIVVSALAGVTNLLLEQASQRVQQTYALSRWAERVLDAYLEIS